jgi:hypothetical protein
MQALRVPVEVIDHRVQQPEIGDEPILADRLADARDGLHHGGDESVFLLDDLDRLGHGVVGLRPDGPRERELRP